MLRTKVAVAVLTLVLLIPIAQGWLGGRTHLISCRRTVFKPFQVLVADGIPVVTGSSRLLTTEDEETCGGLEVELRVGRGPRPGQVEVTILLTNPSPFVWRGSLDLQIGDFEVPVDVGTVPAGDSVETAVTVRVGEGVTDLTGSLVVGP